VYTRIPHKTIQLNNTLYYIIIASLVESDFKSTMTYLVHIAKTHATPHIAFLI